jgi:murein DD-endopeptidase MepM/ murein hydrolase activator NlpD
MPAAPWPRSRGGLVGAPEPDREEEARVRAALSRTVPMVAALAAVAPAPAPAQPVDPPAEEPPQNAGAERDEATRVFPIDGPHSYSDGFGDRPHHEGQDVLAACGTPLRAVKDVTVRRVATEAAAGRYVVLHDTTSGGDYVYMHMSAIDVAAGEHVDAGRRVGAVGQTGDATACHLHFEAWTAPGWYAGGSPHDPMALLRSLGGS